MPAPVALVTIHHQGGGAPTDSSGGYSSGGYTYGIGASRWERFRAVWDSYATLNFNGVSVDVCLSGSRGNTTPAYPVTDADIELIRGALADARARGYVVNAPTVRAHRNSPGSSTACPGDNTMARWADIVAACTAGGSAPAPTKGGAVSAACTPSGGGYYVVDSVGAVFAYGDAKYRGGANDVKLNAPIVAMDVTQDNGGYVLAASDGGTFAYGNARNGSGGKVWSMGGQKLNAPIVDVQLTPDNDGLWLFAADGGVFAFGAAPFLGAPTGKVH